MITKNMQKVCVFKQKPQTMKGLKGVIRALDPRKFCCGARSLKLFSTWRPDKNDDSS